MTKRIVAIILILAVSSVAWMFLGGTTSGRTYNQNSKLYGKVEGLWGTIHEQQAPNVFYVQKTQKKVENDKGKIETLTETSTNNVTLDSSSVNVDFDLTHRKKGLLWYDTYKVDFSAAYKVKNPLTHAETFTINFAFPSQNAIFDNFRFSINGKPVEVNDFSQKVLAIPVVLEAGEEGVIEVGYVSQGLDKWFYKFGEGVNRVQQFSLNMTTNFKDIDFPANSISPTSKEKTASGWKLSWQYKNLISGFQIGMDMPEKLNPGPLASQMSFFAPVSLVFFFFVIFMISVIKDIKIHPMNYIFLAASFFAFHLLFSYIVDHLDIYIAFFVSTAVSMFLAISYMRLVVGARFAAVEVGLSQFIFLILFSFAHFFEGYTGLTITIGAILTLGVMMRLTAKINWAEKFEEMTSSSKIVYLNPNIKTGASEESL